MLVNDAVIESLGRVGSVDQSLGAKSMEIVTEHDLDMDPVALTWRLPQATSSKSSDYPNNQDLIAELHHRGSFYEDWTWLDLGKPAMQFKARIVEMTPNYSGEQGRIRLKWREYRHGTASGETYQERFGTKL